MQMNEYQELAMRTAVYPNNMQVSYPALGLAGEAGEICNIVKKIYRDHGGEITNLVRDKLEMELGDGLWYIAALASDLGLNLETIARRNVAKLKGRQEAGTLHGHARDA